MVSSASNSGENSSSYSSELTILVIVLPIVLVILVAVLAYLICTNNKDERKKANKNKLMANGEKLLDKNNCNNYSFPKQQTSSNINYCSHNSLAKDIAKQPSPLIISEPLPLPPTSLPLTHQIASSPCMKADRSMSLLPPPGGGTIKSILNRPRVYQTPNGQQHQQQQQQVKFARINSRQSLRGRRLSNQGNNAYDGRSYDCNSYNGLLRTYSSSSGPGTNETTLTQRDYKYGFSDSSDDDCVAPTAMAMSSSSSSPPAPPPSVLESVASSALTRQQLQVV